MCSTVRRRVTGLPETGSVSWWVSRVTASWGGVLDAKGLLMMEIAGDH